MNRDMPPRCYAEFIIRHGATSPRLTVVTLDRWAGPSGGRVMFVLLREGDGE